MRPGKATGEERRIDIKQAIGVARIIVIHLDMSNLALFTALPETVAFVHTQLACFRAAPILDRNKAVNNAAQAD